MGFQWPLMTDVFIEKFRLLCLKARRRLRGKTHPPPHPNAPYTHAHIYIRYQAPYIKSAGMALEHTHTHSFISRDVLISDVLIPERVLVVPGTKQWTHRPPVSIISTSLSIRSITVGLPSAESDIF